jgi:hypothetical protein
VPPIPGEMLHVHAGMTICTLRLAVWATASGILNKWQPHTRRSLQAPFACELWSRALLLAEVVVAVGYLACEAAAREAESGAGMRKWYIRLFRNVIRS